MQEHLFSHFLIAGQDEILNDVSITFIDKTDPSDSLRREHYWRQTLKTMVPYRLNIEDRIWWVFLCLLFYTTTSGFLHGYVSMFSGIWFRNSGEFVLSAYIVASVVVSILSLLLLISLSSLLFVLVLLLLLLSLYLSYLFILQLF